MGPIKNKHESFTFENVVLKLIFNLGHLDTYQNFRLSLQLKKKKWKEDLGWREGKTNKGMGNKND